MKYFLETSVLVAHTGAWGGFTCTPECPKKTCRKHLGSSGKWPCLAKTKNCVYSGQNKGHLHKWKDQWSANIGNSASWRSSKTGRRSSSVPHVCSTALVSDPACHWHLSHTVFSECTWAASVCSTRCAGKSLFPLWVPLSCTGAQALQRAREEMLLHYTSRHFSFSLAFILLEFSLK